jgi:hypothetical protein
MSYINIETNQTAYVGLNSIGIIISAENFVNNTPNQFFSVVDNGGFCEFIVSGIIQTPIIIGDTLFFIAAISLGGDEFLGKITAWNPGTNTITTDIPYSASTASGATLQFLHQPIFELYAGHGTLSLVDEFRVDYYKPDTLPAYVGQIVLNGYFKSLFVNVQPVNGGINYSLFYDYEVRYEGNLLQGGKVAYSMLNDTVLSSIAATDGYLNSFGQRPVVFGCGETILTRINNSYVYEEVITNGDFEVEDSFNNDFNNDFS